MLRERVLTAVVLLLVLAGALWVDSPWPFLSLLALACGCATWEWLRLTLPGGSSSRGAIVGGVAVFALCMGLVSTWTGPDSTLGRGNAVLWLTWLINIVALCWIVAVIPAIVRGDATRSGVSPAWSAFALFALPAAWVALALMFLVVSAWFVISLLITVWVADVAAYFVGRAIGKRKLAPRVSPGKTIAGAVAGIGAAVVWIMVSGMLMPGSFGETLIAYWSFAGAVAFSAILGAMSIAGDLFESLLKRRAGVKDSSQLLPGHGGVYDRIDAILPVAVCAQAMLALGAMRGLG